LKQLGGHTDCIVCGSRPTRARGLKPHYGCAF